MRSEPSDKSELCSQLLFGDGYTVLEESTNHKWLHIKSVYDDYEGWIDYMQHNEVNSTHFEAFLMQPHDVNLEDIAILDDAGGTTMALFGSTLPFLHGRKVTIGSKVYDYQGELYEQNTKIEKDFIKFCSLRYLNAPYLWGGKTLFGVDCSGFVQIVYKVLGYQIKRDAYQQATHGSEVKLSDSITGDLAFFENDAGKIVHVGIILEENRIIHAHGFVRIDIVDEKGIFNLTTKKYSHKLTVIKRIISI